MNTRAYRSVLLLVLAFEGVASARAETVFGDDFSSSLAGGTANSSDYALTSTGVFTLPPQYRVISDPSTAFTNNYNSYFDHTSGTASGAMLFFDGAGSPSTRIYYHSIAMTAGVAYTISYWGAASDGASVPVLNLSVDGTTLGTPLTTAVAQWQQSSAVYTPTVTGLHTIAIYDSETINQGNDGSLDDVLVTAPVPEPATFAALGIGTLALLRRRNRA